MASRFLSNYTGDSGSSESSQSEDDDDAWMERFVNSAGEKIIFFLF